jgi:hypothetical protein
MARLIALISCLLAQGASASDWAYGSFDNGAWFEAHVRHASGEMALNCGGVSPGGQPLPQSDEPMITPPYTVDLTLAHPGLGGGDLVVNPPRSDVVVVSGATGYQLPRVVYDELDLSGWVQPLGMGDGLVAALLTAAPIAVDAAGQRLGVYETTGLTGPLAQMIAFCDARWHATGTALPDTALGVVNAVRQQGLDVAPTTAPAAEQQQPAAQPQRVDNGLWASVTDFITRSCEGAVAEYGDGFATAANIDGDGVQDYVIAWDSITCAGNLRRPFCGASQCAVDVFVSSIYTPGDRPKTVYAQGVWVVPGPNGRDLLQLTGRLANCQQPDAPPDCLFLWGWVEGDLQRVN